MRAYILIQTEPGGRQIAGRVITIPGIESADDLEGPYDAIALADGESSADLTRDVIDEIRRLPGVTRALLAPVIRPFAEDSVAVEAVA